MKILYLHQYFVPPDSAGGTRSYEMGKRLVRMGHEVEILTSSAFFSPAFTFTRMINKMDIDGIKLTVLKIPYGNEMSFARRILAFIKFAITSSLILPKFKPDIILATSTPLTVAITGILAKYYRKIPMVFEVRDRWPVLAVEVGALKSKSVIYLARCLEKITYRKSELIIALSPGMKIGIVNTGVPEHKIAVIPNSCDMELFDVPPADGIRFRERFPAISARPWIVYAGTFGLINGLGYMIDMARYMNTINPEVVFVLVGRGMEENQLKKKAAEYDIIDKNVFFLPQIPKREMPGLLSAATVCSSLFLPIEAMWENSANKFFDGLASGTPVMINYYGWQEELLNEYGAGFVIDPFSPEGGAQTLAKKLENPDELIKMGICARELARERFDRNILASQLEEILMNARMNTDNFLKLPGLK